MKRIVLRELPDDVQELIDERAKKDGVDASGAIAAILHDAAIERMVEHDIAILRSNWVEDEGDRKPAPSSGVVITISVQPAHSAARQSRSA